MHFCRILTILFIFFLSYLDDYMTPSESNSLMLYVCVRFLRKRDAYEICFHSSCV